MLFFGGGGLHLRSGCLIFFSHIAHDRQLTMSSDKLLTFDFDDFSSGQDFDLLVVRQMLKAMRERLSIT